MNMQVLNVNKVITRKKSQSPDPLLTTLAISCPGTDCHQVLVTFGTLLTPYPLSCSCAVHKGLDKYSIFKVKPNSVKKL